MLALGNAFLVCLFSSDVARPLLAARARGLRCCVRAASGRRARISAQVRCVGPKQTAAVRPLLAIDSWSAHSSQSVDAGGRQQVQNGRVRTNSSRRCSLRTAPLGVLTDGCKNVDASGL